MMKAARGHDVLIFVCNEQGMTLGAFGSVWNTVAGNAELFVITMSLFTFPTPNQMSAVPFLC
jgi:hypothetical protein